MSVDSQIKDMMQTAQAGMRQRWDELAQDIPVEYPSKNRGILLNSH